MSNRFESYCYVSHQHRFIWILVPKNASSSLRWEFEQPIYEATTNLYRSLAPEIRRDYFTFVFLRDPVERLLSAYQEVSFRADYGYKDYSQMAFAGMPEGFERFEEFLDEVEKYPWDGHVLGQVRCIDGARVDAWGSVESFQTDFARILSQLGIRDALRLPQWRSRSDRVARYGYAAHIIARDELTPRLLDRIRHIYRDDEDLYQKAIRDRDVADLARTDEELRREITRLRGELDEDVGTEPSSG